MLVYLDNGENVKSHPNENFGRELLELFTMGVGNYTERDVREAARAFTGWTNDVLTYKFDADQHDFGEKTFLGRTGPFNGEDIIDTILAQPVTGEFVAAKLYRYFVREEICERGQGGSGAIVPGERLPDQAAADSGCFSRRTSTARLPSRPKSRARFTWSSPRTRRWACARCRRSPTSAG